MSAPLNPTAGNPVLPGSVSRFKIVGHMRVNFEKPQKGNPHQLPVKQHVWPWKSITRFADEANIVCLFDKVRNKVQKVSPRDEIFCAKRVWDYRAECGYMKDIEDAFQELVAEIISGTQTTIHSAQKGIVTAFFALWKTRADYKTADAKAIGFKNLTGTNWSIDQEELFEKSGCSFIREDGIMPSRMVCGMGIQVEIDTHMLKLDSVQWGIIHAQEGHFIVPDYPRHLLIPLTPTLCLCSGGADQTMSKENLAEINGRLKLASREYFFARDLMQCP